MILYNFAFLSKADVEAIKTAALKYPFMDGKETAEGAAKEKKSNEQLELNSGDTLPIYGALIKLILENSTIKNLLHPKAVPRIFINSYRAGSRYGWHVDNATINHSRTDFSFTIWLSDPSEYEGGELQVRLEDDSIRSFKSNAGNILIYPTGELHQVTEVKSGCRQAIVGWITSAIANDVDRAVLFSFGRAYTSVVAHGVPDETRDLLDQVYQVLVRRFSS